VNMGKGHAKPEPEEPEKALNPTFMVAESEDEDEDEHRFLDVEQGEEEVTSPTDRYVHFWSGDVDSF
jgi:protein phosphatase 1 regulatory subunit 37